MKIALLTHSVNPRGGVVHVLELGEALVKLGHEVTIVAPASDKQQLFRPTECQVLLLPLNPIAAGSALASVVRGRITAVKEGLRQHLAQHRYDVYHAHDGIGANALADLQEQGLIPHYVRTVHHVDRYGDEQVQAWEERSIRMATTVLCVSNVWQQKIHSIYQRQAALVRNGIRLSHFSPEVQEADAHWLQSLGVCSTGPRILLVGGVEARKNTIRLLAAFLRLRSQFPTLQLVIAGGASLLDHSSQMQQFCAVAEQAEVNIGKHAPIVITGPLPEAAMPVLYRNCEVVAMPSLLEGFGLAALEGLACGAQVVVSRIPPFTEHFAANDVHWADPLDVESITLALRSALNTGRRYRPGQDWQPPCVCQQFSWHASALMHQDHYLQLHQSSHRIHTERNQDACNELSGEMA